MYLIFNRDSNDKGRKLIYQFCVDIFVNMCILKAFSESFMVHMFKMFKVPADDYRTHIKQINGIEEYLRKFNATIKWPN